MKWFFSSVSGEENSFMYFSFLGKSEWKVWYEVFLVYKGRDLREWRNERGKTCWRNFLAIFFGVENSLVLGLLTDLMLKKINEISYSLISKFLRNSWIFPFAKIFRLFLIRTKVPKEKSGHTNEIKKIHFVLNS